MSESKPPAPRDALKQEFHRIDAELIAAMNGIGRAVASDLEAAELRGALLRARAACENAGVEVETVWESSERERAELEKRVRAFADEQRSVVSLFPRRLRMRIAGLASVAAVVGALLHSHAGWGLLGALVAGVVGFFLADFGIATYFPTPGIRVGRMAASYDLGPLDIWDRREDDAKDFEFGYRDYEARRRRGGPSWIRVK